MIEERDREYLNDPDYNVALGRVMNVDGFKNMTTPNTTADKIYAFSNENVRKLIAHLDLTGKKVATVGSSGDQVLNAILKGAKDITLIDGNPMARYYVELKLASIKNLSLSEFLNYFTNKNILNYVYYSKVSHDLSAEAKIFWDNIMLESGGKANKIMIKNIFHNDKYFNDYQMANTYYRNVSDYDKLKKSIPDVKIDYRLGEFEEFSTMLGDDCYDLIMLSNISDYVSGDIFNKVVSEIYKKNLKSNGSIQIGYDYYMLFAEDKDYTDLIESCPNSRLRQIFVDDAERYMNVKGSLVYLRSEDVSEGDFLEKN